MSITIGTGRSSRIRRAASIPSSFGIFTSRIASLGLLRARERYCFLPSFASAHHLVACPLEELLRSRRMIVSSSAMRMRMRAGY